MLSYIVARNIVEAHGGRIGVISKGEGSGGSCFYVDIPVLEDEMSTSSKVLALKSPKKRISIGRLNSSKNMSTVVSEESISRRSNIMDGRDPSPCTAAGRVTFDAGSSPPALLNKGPSLRKIEEERRVETTTSPTSSQAGTGAASPSTRSSIITRGKHVMGSVLLVDDSASIRRMMAKSLCRVADIGLVDHANDGLEAVGAVQRLLKSGQAPYDFILMDSMVGMYV